MYTCTIHQNVELMLNAVKMDKNSHELTELIVCSKDKKQCMVHHCEQCPDVSVIKQYLEEQMLP